MSIIRVGSGGDDSSRSEGVLVVIQGRGDRTRRPRRPGVPILWPKDVPFPPPKKKAPPPEDKTETEGE